MKGQPSSARKTVARKTPGRVAKATTSGSSVGARGLRNLRVTEVDGRIVLTAEKEIELRCGQASILLAPDGTIRIRGTNIVSSASALNRLRGASVKIN